MIHIILWKWRQPGFRCAYGSKHVNVMLAQLARCISLPYRSVCITDDSEGVDCETFPLWSDHSKMANASGPHLPSCYRRLRIFDAETQVALGAVKGDRILSLDLDAVLVQNVDPLLERTETFVGWAVPGHKHPKVFNGSMFFFEVGSSLQFLWDEFDPVESPKRASAAGYFGSDQAYLSQQMLRRSGTGDWNTKDGVLSYTRDVRRNCALPAHARIVMFHGAAKPWDPNVVRQSPWISKHWRP